jgi:predicted O-methyltransferase YrrM
VNNSIDFIVVNYNTFDFVKLLVKSIDVFVRVPFKIYIIDTSDQTKLLADYYSSRKNIIIDSKKFKCVSSNSAVCNHVGGVNYAFEMGDSEYVCILDPDTVFVNEWTEDIIKLLENNAFVSNRFEPTMNIARPQMMFFKREFWNDNLLRFEDYKDTGGNITLHCQQNKLSFKILDNSYNNKSLISNHVFPWIYCEQCFIHNKPFFLHQGRGGSKGDRSKWMETLMDFLNNVKTDMLLVNVLKSVRNKDEFKSTTSLKFKKDVANFILNEANIKGNVLEIGTNRGYTTVILSIIANALDKKVYSFDNDPKLLKEAILLCKINNINNCYLFEKDVYAESWNLNREFSIVFIDAIHEQNAFQQDLINAEKILLDGGYIIAHDYGLENSHGKPIYEIINNNKDKYEIVKYIGEKSNWNVLGTGKTFDYEGIIIRIKS